MDMISSCLRDSGSCSQCGGGDSPGWMQGRQQGLCALMVQASHKGPSSPASHPAQHQSPTGTRGTNGLKEDHSEWVHAVGTQSPAALPHILPPAHPALGLGEPNLQQGKASQPARLAPNELCRAQHPRQHPPAQRSEDALPTLPGAGAGAALDRSGIRIRLMWPFDVAAWQTGHGSHPATAGPGRGPARCHTLTWSTPATLPRTRGQTVLVVRAAQASR